MIAIIQHYASGGSTVDIIAALPLVVTQAVGDVVTLLGFPVAVLLAVGLWIRSKIQRR